MEPKRKILVCGDVEGKFDALFKRVSTINAKSGPFDTLFCVGNFFGINNKQFEPYRNGAKKVPIQTYILGPNHPEHADLFPSDDSLELCPNLSCLGKRGVYTDSKGLKVAYLSGFAAASSSPHEFSPQDAVELYNACVRGNPSFRGVDILLTSQWPQDITRFDPKPATLTINKTTDLATWLLLKLKPRYHFSGTEGVFYERSPFRPPNLGDHDTSLDVVTRFMGLARVGNPHKDKWIFALNLMPLDKMKINEILQKTTDETVCPFSYEEVDHNIFKTKKKTAGSAQYFYDTNAPAEEPNNKKRPKRQKLEFDQSKCWFCLASPSVEKHLILTVGASSYLALAKGGIVDEHFLICPIEHYQNSLGQPSEVLEEINLFKEAIKKFYQRTGSAAVFFERNYKTSHMQLQSIPIPNAATKEIKEIFMEEAEGQGIKLEELDSHSRLNQVLQPNVPYFTVELPNNTTLFTKIKGNFPLNFGREVLATGPILNLPARTDWRECTLQKPEEESLIQRLRTDFEPFDFTNF